MIRSLVLVFLVSVVLVACKKADETGPIPEIEFISVTPQNVQEYTDSLVFTIKYRDGDGDLGENTSGAENFFLADSRNNVIYKFRIPQLAPDNSNIIIEGNLNVTLANTAIIDGSSSQTFTYSIYVKDRAGNQSNTVVTSPVTVTQ
ncbi:MAG: hypothetical protein AB7P01_00560 [Bacteroidia bacterium]